MNIKSIAQVLCIMVSLMVSWGVTTLHASDEASDDASNDEAPGFSIRNKSPEPIYVRVINVDPDVSLGAIAEARYDRDKYTRLLPKAFSKGKYYEQKIDVNKKTILFVKSKEDAFDIIEFTFAPEKTIYVNWDGEKLYPQRGPLWGATGKTDEGYSLRKNVKLEEIRKWE